MELPEYKRAGKIVYDHEIKNNRPKRHRYTIRFRWRLTTWAAVIILALLATVPDPRAFYMIPLYPHGFNRVIGAAESGGGGIVGYLLHLFLFVTILAARRRWLFFAVTLALIVVCSINTLGCRQILSGLTIDG